jgi:uncharacterized membrane protein YsdA (DUF1294 family)
VAHVVFVAFLLVAPTIALVRLEIRGGLLWVVMTLAGLSLVAFVMQWVDKRRAEAERWRVPESGLHFLELLGGWPGAFLAQRLFRHKTAKLSYQLFFWLIVAVHEYLAVDFLLGWKIAHAVKQWFGG